MEINQDGSVTSKKIISKIPQSQDQVQDHLYRSDRELGSNLDLLKQEKQTLKFFCIYLIHYKFRKNKLTHEDFQSLEFLEHGTDYTDWSICYRAEIEASDSPVAGIWLHIKKQVWDDMYVNTRQYLEAYFYCEIEAGKILVQIPAHCLQYMEFEHSF